MRISILPVAILLVSILTGCAGYDFASNQPSVFAGNDKTMKVKGVDYPTIQPWIPHAIRSLLRDELAARNMIQWADSGSVDYEIQINIISLTSREWASSNENVPALYDNAVTLEAIIYSGLSNQEVWRSGRIRYSEREEYPAEQASSSYVIKHAIRLLADKMRMAF